MLCLPLMLSLRILSLLNCDGNFWRGCNGRISLWSPATNWRNTVKAEQLHCFWHWFWPKRGLCYLRLHQTWQHQESAKWLIQCIMLLMFKELAVNCFPLHQYVILAAFVFKSGLKRIFCWSSSSISLPTSTFSTETLHSTVCATPLVVQVLAFFGEGKKSLLSAAYSWVRTAISFPGILLVWRCWLSG